jgi:4-alpha-glucanotransferase
MTVAVRALRALAKDYGIVRTWRAADGSRRTIDDDTLLRLLPLLGAPLDDLAGAPDAVRALAARRGASSVEPVLVQWGDTPLTFAVRGADDAAVAVTVESEDGDTSEWSFPASGTTITLPGALPFGVHRLHVSGSRTAGGTATVLAAPARLPAAAPSWGVFAPAYALHDHDRSATGTFSTFERLAHWAGTLGARVKGTLPLLATFFGAGNEPNDPSPYAPVSRRHWNEVYLDLALVPDVDEPMVVDPSPGEHVDLAALANAKRAVLERGLARADAEPGRRAEFEQWLRGRDDVRRYAAFRAGAETGEGDAVAADHPVARYHAYVQWLTEHQLDAVAARLRERDQEIYLDLPIGTHPDGFDVHREHDLFAGGASVGAPPDQFFSEGQDWGFPPILPTVARATGHRYLRECIDAHLRVARWLRVDHVIGFHRMWWVPSGASAKEGAYVAYPAEEQYAALALAAHRAGGHVVGENLGTVPPETNRALRSRGMLGMYVVPFRLDAGARRSLDRPAANELACLDTHDTATFATYWRDLDDDERDALLAALRRGNHLDVAEGRAPDALDVQGALFSFLGSSRAQVVLATLEDLWLEEQAQNVPGTTPDQRPNFRRRAGRSLDEIERSKSVRDLLSRLDSARTKGDTR